MRRDERANGRPPGEPIRTENAPPAFLPLAFFVAAAAGLVGAFAVGAARPEDLLRHWAHNRTILTALHLFVLGWGTTLAMGAVYQMAPVVLHGHLHRPRLALAQLAVHVAGVAALVSGFWWVRPRWVLAGAVTVLGSALLFVTGLVRVLRTASYRHRVGTGMAVAAAYLVLTASWGLTLALSLRYGWGLPLGRVIATHLILGAGGWFTVLIAFVSLKLTPLFAAGSPPPPRPAGAVLAALALVPAALVVSLLLLPPAWSGPATAGLSVAGALAALGHAALLWRTAPRRRGRREPPVRFALAASVLFAAAAVLGALGPGTGLVDLIRRPAAAVAYAYFVLTGWVGTMTIGQLYRILPFVIWLQRFRRWKPGEQLPFLHEIADRRVGDVLLALWLGTTLLGTLGLWTGRVPWVGAAMAAGLAAGLLLVYAGVRALTVWNPGVRWPALPPFPVMRAGADAARAGGPVAPGAGEGSRSGA